MIGICGLNFEDYLYMAGILSPILTAHRPSKRLTGMTDLPKLWNFTVSQQKLVSGIVKRPQHKCTRALRSSWRPNLLWTLPLKSPWSVLLRHSQG